MKSSKKGFLSRLRRSDKLILGGIAVLLVATIVLNAMDHFGLKLARAQVMYYLPVLALVALVGWGAFALIRRVKHRLVKVGLGSLAVMLLMIVLIVGFAMLGYIGEITLPHAYKTLTGPTGHKVLVVWRFDDDVERNEASVQARREARLAAYPDSDAENTLADDVTVVFEAYPSALGGLFYRANADVEGKVYLAYTKNVAPMNTIEAPEVEATEAPAEAEAAAEDEAPAEAEEPVEAATIPTAEPAEAAESAEARVIDTPHGTMMLEWLDDGETAHFFVQDPGVAEGGECTVRF